jgi:hypothetical protein
MVTTVWCGSVRRPVAARPGLQCIVPKVDQYGQHTAVHVGTRVL